MKTDPQQNSPLAFAEMFHGDLLQALSAQCGSAWTVGATPAEDTDEAPADPFHAVFNFEGSLNGDLHLNLDADASLAIASALLGKVSEVMGDDQRDALVEFLDAALPAFCESAASAYGVFTASLTVTSIPVPEDLEVHAFTLADAKGAEFRLQLLLASDLVASLAEQLLAQQAEAIEPEPQELEPKETEPQPIELQQAEPQPIELPQVEPRQSEPLRPTAPVDTPATPMAYQAAPAEPVNLDLVLDVELNVTLRFGQRQLTLREVLELTNGSVIELDRQVEEPVELLLDGKVIARGEAVVIDGNYGLRVTEVPQQFTPTMLR